uniref:hypothetical protein n=1 Tax=Fulvivirga sp. TaxID=1931237 RepID=UPI0040499D83
MSNAKDSQNRHEKLIDFLNQFDLYNGGLKKVAKTRHSGKIEDISINEINNAVVVLADVLNLGGGSIGEFDLYELLQKYFRNQEARKEINKILRSL